MSNPGTLNATKTELKETGDMLGERAPRSSTAKPGTCPQPFPAAPQLCLNRYCCSSASQSYRTCLSASTANLLVRHGTPPDPSLQELMPFVWPDWVLCQSVPPSKPPVLGRHSCEPPSWGCSSASSALPSSPLTAIPGALSSSFHLSIALHRELQCSCCQSFLGKADLS